MEINTGLMPAPIVTAALERVHADQGCPVAARRTRRGGDCCDRQMRSKVDGSSVAKVFEAYVKAKAIDLLVMGAYRHSRLNEMVWGGATKTVIGWPPCWVMMSR